MFPMRLQWLLRRACGAGDEPTVNEIVRNLFVDRSLSGRIGAVEASLGLIVCAAGVIGAMFVSVALSERMGLPLRGRWYAQAPTFLLFGVSMMLEWRSFVLLCPGLARAPHPIPLNIAVRQDIRHVALRVPLALWWLAHGVLVVVIADRAVAYVLFKRPTAFEAVVQYSTGGIQLFGAAFAMNTHLLLATYALTRDAGAVRFVWRLRIVWDALVTTLFAGFAQRVIAVP
jgi:hypothetical protein